MTKLAPETTLNDLELEEGDAITGIMENGQIIVTVHPADEIADLETSIDESREEKGIPLNDEYFEGIKSKFNLPD